MGERPPQTPEILPKGYPFREHLESSEFSWKIRYFKSLPEKLVRPHRLSAGGLNHFRRGIELFRSLESKYGVAIPKMELVLGGDRGREEAFTVVDRIHGKNLRELETLPAEGVGEFDHLFSALTGYYADVFREGGDCWWDLHSHQIVYGHKKDEARNPGPYRGR